MNSLIACRTTVSILVAGQIGVKSYSTTDVNLGLVRLVAVNELRWRVVEELSWSV